WTVYAYRQLPNVDSLSAQNGPRAITLTRGVPALSAFNLSSPASGTTIQTTPTDISLAKPNWTKSGQGVKYKFKYAVPNFSNPANVKAIYQSDNTGFDTLVSIRVSTLDSLAASLGVGNNDSVSGQWRVYAYAGTDSTASTQTFDLKLRRLPITNVTIGNGTAAESYPLNRFYNYFRWQGIYLGSEIGISGTIRKIKFYQNNSVGSITNENLRVFMKTTPDEILTTGLWDSTGMTLVFSGTITSLSSPGWAEIQLTTPIAFNTSQNIMIAIGRDFQQYVSTYPRYAYTSTSPNNMTRRGQSDTQYPTTLTQSLNRANIQFELSLLTGIAANSISQTPEMFSLSQNYPNPFNPTTKINYSLPVSNFVSIKIFDVLGKEVVNLINERQNAGTYSVEFNAGNLSSGVYFYRIDAGEFTDIKRMVLIK
ncbi:MAG: T9SS type A sorting domain-containing protein, partial [bacterium]